MQWAPKVEAALQKIRLITEVNLDQQQKGLESDLVIDRATAARLGLNVSEIDNTLYDAFGQRQVSVIYAAQNQYHVVMEVAPQYWQNPETLKDVYVSTSGGTVSGTKSTNALAGTVAARGDRQQRGQHERQQRGDRGHRQCGDDRRQQRGDRNHQQCGERRRQQCSDRRRGEHQRQAIASDTARNQANNSLANTGHGADLDRCRGQHRGRNHGAALGVRPLPAGQHAARGQSPEPVRRRDDLVQPGARRVAGPGAAGDRRSGQPPRHAGDDPRQLSGHRAGL